MKAACRGASALTFMVVLLVALLFATATGTEYRGTLESRLVLPPNLHQSNSFTLATEQQKQLLDGDISKSDKVFAGTIRGATAFVVEHEHLKPTLYVDKNRDGRITPDEKFSLGPGMHDLLAGVVEVEFPLPGGTPSEYPVRVYVYRAQKDPNSRIVGESPFVNLRGTVNVNGRPVLVEYRFDEKKRAVDLTHGWQGLDVNGDGYIDTDVTSPEYLFADDETLIFQVGSVYLSTKSIDFEKHEVVLVAHDSSEYHTIALKPGVAVPNFQFTDFGGQHRKLSDFAGKLVLLDFWASWCHPCVSELPMVKSAYDELHSRGLEVIGMNVDEDTARAREMIAWEKLDYPQAAFESIRELEEKRFRIRAFPTYVLIGPGGKILAVDFSGKKILDGLEHWLSPRPQ
jgi:thiol-disulfide isomerase/thioredoxin